MELNSRCLKETLDILKISSKESVENLGEFSVFKEYMHVERNVQDELIQIIEKVKESSNSQLVLVCGSVGDGKSHLLSYLKHQYSELLQDVRLYNDASESFNPEDTDMDTLNRELAAFSDENLGNAEQQKILIAINLGTLSNFIESKYKDRYSQFREFVYKHHILDNHVSEATGYQEDSNFQFINFSDYHMYTLTQEGAQSLYIKTLLDRLVAKVEDNIFYQSYLHNCRTCKHRMHCTVKVNYNLLQEEGIRIGISNVLIKAMLKEKLIISTRELLNFFNDMLVGGISIEELNKLNEKHTGLDKVLLQKELLMPNIIFEKRQLSPVIEKLSAIDPLITKDKTIENEVIQYQMTNQIVTSIRDDLPELDRVFSAYMAETVSEAEAAGLSQNKLLDIRYEFFKLYKRTKYLVGLFAEDTVYKQYLKDLYASNKKDKDLLKDLLKEVKENLYKWDGSPQSKGIRVSSSKRHRTMGIYEPLNIGYYLKELSKTDQEPIEKFVTSITLKYTCDNGQSIASLDIDYGLYELLKKMSKGYIPNKEEQKKNLTLQLFLEQLLKSNEVFTQDAEEKELIFEVLEKDKTSRYKLILNEFGDYEFRGN